MHMKGRRLKKMNHDPSTGTPDDTAERMNTKLKKLLQERIGGLCFMKTILVGLVFLAISAGVVSAADAKAGKAAYDKACKSCHGADGTPNPAIAKMTKVEMRDLKSPEVQGMGNAELSSAITQ